MYNLLLFYPAERHVFKLRGKGDMIAIFQVIIARDNMPYCLSRRNGYTGLSYPY